jgi:hypothetical protein
MLYRAAIFGIIAFWLVMMAMLVRLETHPEATDILDVPVAYVMRLMFVHGQTSFLTVHDASNASVGTIYLRPTTTGTNARTLNYSGTLLVPLPDATGQRLNFNGVIDLSGPLRVRDFRAELSFRDSPYRLTLYGDAVTNKLSYQITFETRPVASQTVPMDASGISTILAQNMGMRTMPPVSLSSISEPVVMARESEITLSGEKVEVYQVSVTEGTSPVMDIYVSQVGQIVSAKTSFGYTLTPEE